MSACRGRLTTYELPRDEELPFSFFIMRKPHDGDPAGDRRGGAARRLVVAGLHQVQPAAVAVSAGSSLHFQFVWVLNELLFGITLSFSQEVRPVMAPLAGLQGSYGTAGPPVVLAVAPGLPPRGDHLPGVSAHVRRRLRTNIERRTGSNTYQLTPDGHGWRSTRKSTTGSCHHSPPRTDHPHPSNSASPSRCLPPRPRLHRPRPSRPRRITQDKRTTSRNRGFASSRCPPPPGITRSQQRQP
jgi:hypothetical protein